MRHQKTKWCAGLVVQGSMIYQTVCLSTTNCGPNDEFKPPFLQPRAKLLKTRGRESTIIFNVWFWTRVSANSKHQDHISNRISTAWIQFYDDYLLDCFREETFRNILALRKSFYNMHVDLGGLLINMQIYSPKPYLVMPFDIYEVRSADGKSLRGSVMNILFMMEFTNSRSKSCEFPLRLFRSARSWRQNLQFKLTTHNSSLANLWNATSLT